MKNKIMVFAWYNYYPKGGVNDLVGIFETEKEAEEFSKKLDKERIDIIEMYNIKSKETEELYCSYPEGY